MCWVGRIAFQALLPRNHIVRLSGITLFLIVRPNLYAGITEDFFEGFMIQVPIGLVARAETTALQRVVEESWRGQGCLGLSLGRRHDLRTSLTIKGLSLHSYSIDG